MMTQRVPKTVRWGAMALLAGWLIAAAAVVYAVALLLNAISA